MPLKTITRKYPTHAYQQAAAGRLSCDTLRSRSKKPNGHRRRSALYAVVALGLAGVFAGAVAPSSASAVGNVRDAFPIVAGTRLSFHEASPPGTFTRDSYCTAGAVLKATALYARILPSAAARRYVVTAKHCAPLGASVSVADEQVGTVTWVSPDRDVEIITVNARATRRQECHGTISGIPRCTITATYVPQASGKVILDAPFTGLERAIPVAGSGAPAPGQQVCTSGYVSGVNCSFTPLPLPPAQEAESAAKGLKAIRSTSGVGTDFGDSGGPVVSPSGVLYGIHKGSADPEHFSAVSVYTPISEVFREQPYYQLAPAS